MPAEESASPVGWGEKDDRESGNRVEVIQNRFQKCFTVTVLGHYSLLKFLVKLSLICFFQWTHSCLSNCWTSTCSHPIFDAHSGYPWNMNWKLSVNIRTAARFTLGRLVLSGADQRPPSITLTSTFAFPPHIKGIVQPFLHWHWSLAFLVNHRVNQCPIWT